MKYKSKNNSKSKNTYKTKMIILCMSIALLVIAGGAIMAQRFISSKDIVQAKDNQIISNDNNEVSDNQNNQDNKENLNIPHDSPAFVQKYLDQQMKGQMPDGADGVKAVYLTFDDGPSETVTPKILDILKSENVHGTFFVLGKAIDSSNENKELIKRIVSEGNAIGNHSYSHDYNYLYPNRIVNLDHFKEELEKTNTALKKVLGNDFSTKAIRLPGGHMTWKGTAPLDEYFKENGYSYIDWNALSKDAEGPKKNADQLVQQAIETSGTKQKIVLLMHDTYGKEKEKEDES